MQDYSAQIEEILDASRTHISTISPSEWAEKNIIMPKPFPGPLSYDKTPYTREIIDCLSPYHPAREVVVMGAAQWGKTASIIIPWIGYIIANDPGNIIMTVGHEDLVEEAMSKIDAMLDTTGLRKLIRPQAMRAKSQKSGDTNTIKQFPNGYFKISTASNPKIWRQADYKYGVLDDYEAVKGGTKFAGNTRDLVDKRFTAYHTTRKVLYVSSPELEQGSNILEVYNMGDQRKFLIPCPCCGEYIELRWNIEGKNGKPAGMNWQLDEQGALIEESVGYICQKCDDLFTDHNKGEIIPKGFWQPTTKPFRPDVTSYHMSSFYSPHGMTDWKGYVYKWIEGNPTNGTRNQKKYQTFLNLNEGLPYKEEGESPNANQVQNNIRNYEVNIVPEALSIQDGNGKIVLLTFASDMNGTPEDARVDWEVLAWSESGSNYSVCHGSIGTFVPREGEKKFKEDREHWSYELNRPNSVWPEVDKIMNTVWSTDTDRKMLIYMGGLDTGHYTTQAYNYLDRTNAPCVALKGDKEDKYVKLGIDMPSFKVGRERINLFIVQVGLLKDKISEQIRLKYDEYNDDRQPAGFMNYPMPSQGLYLFKNYFSHYEAEQRVVESNDNGDVSVIWKKKSSLHQNHFWDVRIYNMVMRDIVLYKVGQELKIPKLTWREFADFVLKHQ